MSADELVAEFIDAAVQHPERARTLAAQNPTLVNARWIHQETVVHFLSVEGFAEAVGLLIELGADPNLRNEFGDPPLIDVALLGNAEVAALLVSAGADVNAKSETHDNVLHCAVRSGEPKLVDLLLSAGAQADYVTDLDESVFDALPDDESAASSVRAVLERHGVRKDAV